MGRRSREKRGKEEKRFGKEEIYYAKYKILRLDGFGNEATLIYAILAVYRSGQDSQ